MENNLLELIEYVETHLMDLDHQNVINKITTSMADNPDSAIPHNLLGIILVKNGHYDLAMNHFRAAVALDPTYTPANYNLIWCDDSKFYPVFSRSSII
ncbi:MAG: tetratricopeptide repeat protein [Erysipelothrix sp.]